MVLQEETVEKSSQNHAKPLVKGIQQPGEMPHFFHPLKGLNVSGAQFGVLKGLSGNDSQKLGISSQHGMFL